MWVFIWWARFLTQTVCGWLVWYLFLKQHCFPVNPAQSWLRTRIFSWSRRLWLSWLGSHTVSFGFYAFFFREMFFTYWASFRRWVIILGLLFRLLLWTRLALIKLVLWIQHWLCLMAHGVLNSKFFLLKSNASKLIVLIVLIAHVSRCWKNIVIKLRLLIRL